MPAGDKLLNAVGHNGYQPNRFREFHGIFHPRSNHTFYPPRHPDTGEVLVSVREYVLPKRTAKIIRDAAGALEEAKAQGLPLAYQSSKAKQTGMKGYSLFFAPSPAHRQAYPHLSYLWDIGLATAPCDTVLLLLLNVAPRIWKLIAGLMPIDGGGPQDYVLSQQNRALIGKEMEQARQTVPLSQARYLQNSSIKNKSFKALDWMYWLLRLAEVQFAQ